jgi:RNA polymerase sigma-70 factor (ECF subfamily)
MARSDPDRTVDELLVLGCVAGRADAFAALYDRWHGRLLAHAARLVGRARLDRAEDACQDAWVAIGTGITRLSDPRRFPAWAYSIVTRRVADDARRAARAGRALEQLLSETVNAIDPPGDSRDERTDLRVALDELPSQDRALLRLVYLEELSVAETAEALAVPVGTVKSRLFHARQRLRRAFHRSER